MIHIKEHEVEGDRFEKPFARVVKHIAAPWTVGTTKMWFGLSIIDAKSRSNPHRHNDAEEIFYVISGKGKIRVDQEEENVGPGSCVFVPIGMEHQLINENDEIFKVAAVTSPPFQLQQFNDTHLKK